MGALLAYFNKERPSDVNLGLVIKHNLLTHFRGVFGVLIPVIALPLQIKTKDDHHLFVQCLWIWMIWTILIQPVNVPVAGLMPLFVLPMTGTMRSIDVCGCYFNENAALFILGGWMLLLLNNSGFDRRFTLMLLCSKTGYSSASLLLRSCTAAFILSMISNRLIVTANIIQYVMPSLTSLQSSKKSSEPDYNFVRYIIICGIHTSSAIGSIVMVHASLTILALKSIFFGSAPKNMEYSDVFSYMHYTAFALPVAIVMFILNIIYYTILLITKKSMSDSSKSVFQKEFQKQRNLLPKHATMHERLSIFFTILCLGMFLSRWSTWFHGWAYKNRTETNPYVKDATIAALFVILLSILPSSFGFLKYITANKKSQLPPAKPESAILWWRFIDKNTNYGYIFLIGGGLALAKSASLSNLDTHIQDGLGAIFTSQPHIVLMLIIVLLTVFLSNIMTSVGALIVFLPFVLCMVKPDSSHYDRRHYGALGVGIGASLGFMWPFLYTPGYFAHSVGKVPKSTMATYGLGSSIICAVVLWLALCFFADVVLENKLVLIQMTKVVAKNVSEVAEETTTEAS